MKKKNEPISIRDTIRTRAAELGMNVDAIHSLIPKGRDGKEVVSVSNLYRYWAEESDMTGSKIDAVMAVLGLRVQRHIEEHADQVIAVTDRDMRTRR